MITTTLERIIEAVAITGLLTLAAPDADVQLPLSAPTSLSDEVSVEHRQPYESVHFFNLEQSRIGID